MASLRQKILIVSFAANFILMLHIAILQHRCISDNHDGNNTKEKAVVHNKQPSFHTAQDVSKSITVVLRDFETFDNAIIETIRELYSVLNGTKVLVVGDANPYPPLKLDTNWNVEVVSLQPHLLHNYSSSRPDHLIKTTYVLVLPDAAKIKHWKYLQGTIGMLGQQGRTQAVAMNVGIERPVCSTLDVDLKRWQISWGVVANTSIDYCDVRLGDQALLMRTETFRSLAEPFARPFPITFHIQAKLRQWKVRYFTQQQLGWVKQLFSNPHNKWKHKQLEEERLSSFYKHVSVKAVVKPNGKTEYYGCSKDTPRCFGTIIDDMPEYLYDGKWTPPCCLKALRETAQHVFKILEKEGVRYWLEGGSLLGAARNGDIIPWDYDVDIGIYKDDINMSSNLREAKERNFVDDDGFVWEKAMEGDFYRVQYSEHNHLHVDIHPFYSKGGTMTKDTWFETHRQDTEFPEYFLKPLTKIPFVGVMAGAPNNVRQFLEFKFGVGVIEQPRFPNLKRVHE